MKILVLGSEGFIGRHAVKFYLATGWQVTGCDLFEAPTQAYTYVKLSRLSPELDDLMQGQSYDYCINAAGSGNVSYSVSHPMIDFEANTLDVIRLLDAFRKWQPACKYIHISSAAVYGNPDKLPVTEELPCKPVSPYGYHKWMAETICREYAGIFNLHIAVVRPFSVFGPGLQKQLFWDLFQKYRLSPASIEIWGTGNESRDFIFIDDLIRAIHCIIEKGDFNCTVYNLASGEETTIKQAVETLFGELDKHVRLTFNNKVRAGDPLNWRADIQRLQFTGFKPEVSFEEGMHKLAAWYRSRN